MWCPKCRVEYQEGVTVCADCGTALVEGTEEDFDIVDICSLKDEQMADKFLEYLKYSKLDGARKLFDEESGVYTVAVPPKAEKKAEKLFDGFMMALEEEQEEKRRKEEEEARAGYTKEELEEMELDRKIKEKFDSLFPPEEEEEEKPQKDSREYDWDAEEEEEEQMTPEDPFDEEDVSDLLTEGAVDDVPREMLYHASDEYVKKSDEYRDLKYSGLTFIVFSVLGWVYLLLCYLEIFPIHYNPVVFAGIFIMFTCFCLIGISSMVKSSKAKSLIADEEERMSVIKEWLGENLTDEILNGWKDDTVSDEENDLLLMAHIRKSLTKQFPKEDTLFLEMMSEEYYDKHCEERENN